MARSHEAKRHLNDFPGSSYGSESDGYVSLYNFTDQGIAKSRSDIRMSPPS